MIKLSHSTEYIASFTEVLNILNEIKRKLSYIRTFFYQSSMYFLWPTSC